MGSRRSRSSRGRIRVIPKHRPEPDLDRVVLALLAMLDEEQRASDSDTPGDSNGDAS
jgi:hypothetical protein